jgi:hypothetical protein
MSSPASASRTLAVLGALFVVVLLVFLAVRPQKKTDETAGTTPPSLPTAKSAGWIDGLSINALANAAAPSSEPRFRSASEIYLHFRLDRPATVFAASLGSRLELNVASPVPTKFAAGPATLGPFELDDNVGPEAYILLASESARTNEDFRALLERAQNATSGNAGPHAQKLQAVLDALRKESGLQAESVLFEHVR